MTKNPYFDITSCVERLLEQYKKYGSLIVAVDFDDTVFDFHKNGFEFPAVITLLKECNKLNFNVCVFTASGKARYDFIKEHMIKLGIKVDSINENPFPLEFGNNGKMFYNILLDDRAGLGQAYHTLREVVDHINLEKHEQRVTH